ncbi:MAG: tRNA (adenosine(37)-N6)-threonylcarbamoyltransferase complex transferase subunit TsaD [Desulfovibrionaceae bacterium]|nr:tRNA (adenosine(37)-N6)-threonylcarbamoyltransferase complex transferase subunit TsaD [Desulfovibrionaceae bacterium]
MLCLGIESSCDETALALVRDGRLIDSVLATQIDLHALFGGVVPELASREHYRFIGRLYDELMRRTGMKLSDADVIAVTRGPGLLGSLLVGAAFAKGLAVAGNKPLVAVNHLHAHLLAVGLERELRWPLVGLLVSGGHTHLYRIEGPDRFIRLGRTLDDAAGEACDKFAKMLGLPYPGGVILDRLAAHGTADRQLFPRPYLRSDTLDYSFSGLKTAALTWLKAHPEIVAEGNLLQQRGLDTASRALQDVCASYMAAVVDTLLVKLGRAVDHFSDIHQMVIAGGVAANSQLRAAAECFAADRGIELMMPSGKLCTDNAAMIAYLGCRLAQLGYGHGAEFESVPRGRSIPDDAGRLKPFFGEQ